MKCGDDKALAARIEERIRNPKPRVVSPPGCPVPAAPPAPDPIAVIARLAAEHIMWQAWHDADQVFPEGKEITDTGITDEEWDRWHEAEMERWSRRTRFLD